MNIFYLDEDVKTCARFHCDKHVVKMILEYAQLLSGVVQLSPELDKSNVYKLTHQNHPCALWTRKSTKHFDYLICLFNALCDEYTLRYKKVHACDSKLRNYFGSLPKYPSILGSDFWCDPPLAMPDKYKKSSCVDSYRSYYIGEKGGFAKWSSPSSTPKWFETSI